MKLLTKSSIYFVVTSLLVFLLSGVAIYFMLQTIILEEVDELLIDKKEDLLWDLKKVKGFDNLVIPNDSLIVIEPVLSPKLTRPVFRDTMLINILEDEFEHYRYVQFQASFGQQERLITIYQSKIDTDDLVEAIIYSLIIIFVITLLAIMILNYFGMRSLWQPFYKILKQIKVFDFKKSAGFESVATDTTEFKDLNSELIEMTNKLTRDYYSLKEFSENASHEMQTPLAIIQSKLELIFQQQNISEEHLKSLNSAYQAANRLSRLHSELNLLTRIDNQEFKKDSSVSLKKLLNEQIENFEDILNLKKLKLDKIFDAEPLLLCNSYLLEILFSNLFNNAIKHNIAQGFINIQLKSHSVEISNSGLEPGMPTENLFERFRKGQPAQNSTGLGLALVKQICLVHDFVISYTYVDKIHTIKIDFGSID